MPILAQDLRYGVRTLARTPGFTAIAVAVLALGIGVNATVFSLANALFLRPLAVNDPGTVVRVYSNRFSNTVQPLYVELRDRNSTLTGLAGFQTQSFGVRIDADTEHGFGQIVSGNYFPVLGVVPARGRLLTAADDRDGADPAVVLSYAFWQRRFGGAGDIVGRTMAVNGARFTVVGVTPRGFTGVMAPIDNDFWVPLAAQTVLRPGSAARGGGTSLHLIGRLKPGVDRRQAQADLDAIGRQVRASAGEAAPREAAVSVYGPTILHPEIATPLTAFVAVLMVVVALVLLIVCVNLANLVLARAAGRGAELAIRQSLGAGRGRLVRQLLTESLLLSIAGAAGGIWIALGSTRALMAAPLPVPVPVLLDLSLDWRVLAFTAAVAVAATIASGLLPALSASKVDLTRAIKDVGGQGPRHSRLRSAFLIAQVSMSVLLLVTAGLFIRSFRNAEAIDTGFDADRVLTATVDLGTRGYSEARGREFVRALSERLQAAPGIVSVNAVDTVPMTLSNTSNFMLRDGDSEPAEGQSPAMPQVYMNAVGPAHFRTLQIGLVAGRDFTWQDDANAAKVAIVNETLAKRFWPGKSAVGQRLRPLGASANAVEIVGVVRDSKYVSIGEAATPFLYRPIAQAYTPQVTLLVRAIGTPQSVLPIVKEQVRQLDAGLPVFNVATLTAATAVSRLPARIAGSLLAAMGSLALVLAALGIYGVLSFLVRARTREIGIRVAIGATPAAVAAMVVRQTMSWTAGGALLGLTLAFVLTRFLGSFLYGVSATDPLIFGGVTLLLLAVAGIAAAVPAMRASRLDPLVALRNR
jgi:predicted permease